MRLQNLQATWLIAAFLSALLSPALLAQTSGTGALTGTVTDPSGAVVPGVTVTVTSTDTAQVRTATTGGDGSYKIGLLPPGDYRVKFEASGFKASEVPSATVAVTETDVLDQKLEVGSQTQEVTVQANVETVQTASSTVGTVVQGVQDYPLATRNYVNLLGLSAGANGSVNNAASALGKGTQSIAVNGAAASDNNYQMDGVSIVSFASSGGVGEAGTFGAFGIPNPDAVQEFKIQTSTYDASYGRNSGGNVNVVTKSGSNEYHGTAFEFFRNTVLNANDFFLKATELGSGKPNKEAVLDQNQYGGVFGGPIKKNKLFFFVSFQETAQKNGLASNALSSFTLPYITPLSVSSDRTSTAWLNDMYAHYCGKTGTVGGGGGVAFKCSAAAPTTNTAAAFNPQALNILNLKLANGSYYIPSPLDPSTSISCTPSGSCTSSIPAIYHEYQGVGNWDWVINSKNTLSGREFYSIDPALLPFPVTGSLPGMPANSQFPNDDAVLKLTTVLSSNVVNEARISFQRNVAQDSEGGQFTSTQVGVAPVTNNSAVNLLPQTNTGTFSIGAYQFGLALSLANQYQIADQLSMTRGKHTLRFGFEGARYLWNYSFPALSIGALSYGSFNDFLLSLPGCTPGDAACSKANPTTTVDLNGNTVPNNGTANSNLSVGGATTRFSANPPGYINHYYANYVDAFIQDDFKFSPRLTINMGLRWEYDGEVSAQLGKNVNVDPSRITGTPFPLATTSCQGILFPNPCSGGSFVGYVVPSNYNPSVLGALPPGVFISSHTIASSAAVPKDDFAPRLGFAWQPLSNGKFVVRGGGGFFYNRLPGDNYIHTVLQNVPAALTITTQPFADLANPYGNAQPGWAYRYVTAGGTSSNISNQAISNKMTTPVVYEWSLNTQYEFRPGWVVELGYVGSRGIHQFTAGDVINGAPLVSVASPAANGSGATTNTTTNTALRAPYPGFATSWALEASNIDLKYNSAQATLRKQFSHGFNFQAAYTWSRGFSSNYYGNPNDTTPGVNPVISKYFLNSGYHPQRLSLNYTWNLPFGHADGIKGKLIEGWLVSGVTIIQDGTPITITDSRLGTIFGSPAGSTAQFCPGATNGMIATTGSTYARVVSGLSGGAGFLSKTPFAFAGSACPLSVPTGADAATNPAWAIYGNGNGYGNAGEDELLGPGQDNWDISLAKITTVSGLRENATLQFRAEFLNAFNHPQFNNPTTALTNGAYGHITGASVNPRLIQFALKYSF